jgi:cysteine synthase A
MLEGLGAEVVVLPQVDGSPGNVTGADLAAAERLARAIADERGGFYVDQFNAPEAVRAHEDGTGRELWLQSGGRIDAWVAAVGTGATFRGVAARLKRHNPGIVCAAVEPEGCSVLAGEPVTKPRHLLQGTSYGSMPPLWRPELMDLSIAVSDAEAAEWRDILARREGLYVGYSTAANVCAAVKLLGSGRLPGPAPTVATLLCDTGLKY